MAERDAVRRVTVTALAAYTVVVGVLAVLSGVAAWRLAERAASAKRAIPTSYLGLDFSVSPESSIFLVVVCFGIMGSIVHVATSLASFVGNGRFQTSWTIWYVLRPLIAAVLATIAYVAFRAGFLSAQADADSVNLFGVAAIAALAGIFSKQVTDKLEDVMDVVFSSKQDGKRGDKLQKPKITRVTPRTAPAQTAVTITVEGTAFGEGASVLVAGEARAPGSHSGNRLELELAPGDLPSPGHTVELKVRSASGEESEPFGLQVT